MEDRKTALKNIALRVLFILAIVIIILILAFAVIRFVPMVFSSFASVGSLISSQISGNKIAVSVNDASLNDGDEFELTWILKQKVLAKINLTIIALMV